MMQYLFDHQLLPESEKALYTTFLASSFRTLRFGVHEAHGKGMALQFNYLTDKGAFVQAGWHLRRGFDQDQAGAVRDLVHDLLEIEATGDYERAKKMLDTLGILRPAMQKALDRLTDLPTDIEPVQGRLVSFSPREPVRRLSYRGLPSRDDFRRPESQLMDSRQARHAETISQPVHRRGP